MENKLTVKQLKNMLNLYPNDMPVKFITEAEKIMVWYGADKPDWAIKIEQAQGKLYIYIAKYKQGVMANE